MAAERLPRPPRRRFALFAHGAKTDGHDPLFVYRCRSSRRLVGRHGRTTVLCGNRVGERLRLVFDMP